MFSGKIHSVKELEPAAREIIEEFKDHRVFALYGKMGAGKTTFIQALCKALGSEDYVTSPTFALVNEYSDRHFSPVYHFDFYRIKKIEEAFDMGYEEYLYSGHYCFIEWPEMIEPILPENLVEIRIEVEENENRRISALIK